MGFGVIPACMVPRYVATPTESRTGAGCLAIPVMFKNRRVLSNRLNNDTGLDIFLFMPIEQEQPPIVDEVEIDDIETLKRLANPMRLRLLFYFRNPMSVGDVAAAMGVPVTRLYYHVKMLEDAGVIFVIATRKRGPQLEKVYRIVAHTIRPGASILDGGVEPTEFAEVAASLVLDSARAELVASLAKHAARGFDPQSIDGTLGRTIVRLSPEHAADLNRRLEGLVHEVKEQDSGDDTHLLYGLTYTFFPIEPPNEPTPPTEARA
jgi:DNA-binding transcriptional ArsR family regulator